MIENVLLFGHRLDTPTNWPVFDYVLVDECQDLKVETFHLVAQAFGSEQTNFTFVGDPKQLASVEAGAVLARVGLEAAAKRPIAEVAYGEKRRVEIAMALAQKPRVLLLDEPLAGLSREERTQLKGLIAGIPRETTVVMIEHDMDTALDLADRITVLHYGRVIVEGTRAEVVADPKTREVYLGH